MDRKNQDREKTSTSSHTSQNNDRSSSSNIYNMNRNHNNYKIYNDNNYPPSKKFKWNNSYGRRYNNNQNWYGKKCIKPGDENNTTSYYNKHKNNHYHRYKYRNFNRQENDHHNSGSHKNFTSTSTQLLNQDKYEHRNFDRQSNEHNNSKSDDCSSFANYYAESNQNSFYNGRVSDSYVLNFNKEFYDQTQRQIQNSNPFYDSYFKYIEPDQTAVEENIITEQNDQENTNDQYSSSPKISLVPLSFLLNEKFQSDSEFIKNQQQINTTTTIAAETSSTANVIAATTAQTVQDPEKIKKRLLNRLVKMDKTDIKNVINNPTTKFDTVLKIHARKKLREEIRKQLKNMNIVNTARSIGEKTNEDVFEPDESVDCGQIPDAILNEISKSLNIELLTEAGLHEDENYLSEIDATTLLSAEDLMAATTMTTTKATTAIPTAITTTTATTMTTSTISVPSTLSGSLLQIISQQENSKDESIDVNPAQSSSTYSPLQHSLLQTQLSKSTSDKTHKKSSPKKSSPKKITSKDEIKNKQKYTKANKIVTVNRSSSNSSSESIDSSFSDSELSSISNNSGDSSSSTSSDNRNNDNCEGSESSTIKTVKKKKMLESNVITHFNTLILPIMHIREQNKLEKRKFRNNTENLLFILEYCFKETANSAIVVTDYQKRILRKQIKSKNNEKVLEFLIEKIKEIFEVNKSKKKTSSSKVQNENSNICEKTKDSNNKQKANKPKKQHSNEKRSDSISSTTSTGTNNSNCVDVVSDSFTKMPTKVKTSQKSQLQKESSLNNESLSRNSLSTSINAGNSRINTRNALQLKSNPIKTSKSNDKHIQDNNFNLSKETFIDEHKEINNCTEAMTPSVQVKIDLSAISATSITGSGNAGSDINNTCVGNTDGKNQKKSDGIIQLSGTDKGDSESKTEVGSNEKTASNPEIWCNKNKRNVVATTDGLKENSKQNDNKASENDLNEILNEENNLNSNIRQNEIISLIGENDDKNHLTSESLKHNKTQRSWKSPGEKKCIQTPKENSVYNRNCSNHNGNDNFQTRNEIHNRNDTILNDLNLNYNNLLTTSELYNSTESLRLLSLIQQNKLSDAVLNNLKEIDVKLIELHKRKMFIEEMILKMQKDKMALERDSMQLQQEKFIIINTALSNTNISSYVNSNYQLQTNFDIKTESSPMKINLCSDDSDIGSAVDNDNIGWSNATDIMTNLLSMSSASSQLNQRKRKLIQKEKLDSKKSCKSLNFSNMTNNNVKITQSSDNLLTLRGSQNENRSLTEKRKVENTLLSKNSTVEVITSGTKIVHSNGNCSSKKKCSSKNLNLDTCESISVEKNSNNDEFSENTEEDEIEEDIEQVEQIEQIEDNAISDGSFENLKFPITHIEVANEFLIAASEDGNIYKFDLKTKKLISKYSKHTETVTGIRVYSCNNFVYSISLDGYLKKTCLENFGLELQSTNLQEPLQCFDLHWDIAFIGSRWGNIFTYKIKTNKLSDTLLCSVGSSITALKATKEGARKILIISSRGNEINFRDATSGLLLRTIQIPENLNIYSILLDGDLLYCGSNKNEIHLFNFTTGTKTDIFKCGNGAFSMKLYKGKLLFVGCYDGFVYVLDKLNGSQIGRFPGAGKMILALHIVGEKFITSSKDNIMDIRSIPKYIPALLK